MHIKSLERIKRCFISHIEPGQIFSLGEKLYLRCRLNRVVDIQSHEVLIMDTENDVLRDLAGEFVGPCKHKQEVSIYNAGLVILPWQESHDTESVLVDAILFQWTDPEDDTKGSNED